ncbi:outer membrane protein [Bradyrhizobium neotropicale]|uniref:outer membrane protein n=1 Tax=Bradyrhizobium neotropicale TaxID=1497615 RepID=UPI001AD7BABD|nr:outer membrane beta-barrel protein [Bradyrhizobium neotropicale]MBO4225277.1 outer membrane beta-barrel protein [Bradyrhizobium neotropicale]
MRNVKRKTLSALTMSALLSPAGVSMAQSLPEPLKPIGNLSSPFNLIIPNYGEAPLPSSWQGFYFKPSIGYSSISFGNQLSDAKGITLGASGGYDFRYNNFVFGPTADLNYDFLSGSESSVNGMSGYRARIDFDGSVGARAGYLWGRTLIYMTGGYAFANMSVKNDAFGLSDSRTLSGWTAGGGLEYLWSEHDSLRFAYRRVQFFDESFDSLPIDGNKVKFNMNKFDIGFVHRF